MNGKRREGEINDHYVILVVWKGRTNSEKIVQLLPFWGWLLFIK
jgi:hypothetical protein